MEANLEKVNKEAIVNDVSFNKQMNGLIITRRPSQQIGERIIKKGRAEYFKRMPKNVPGSIRGIGDKHKT
jgi:hypothetical protein